jgi:hypothetical protein
MRYPASETLEIIRLVERSHLPTKRMLVMLGIPRTTFYRWYDRYIALGEAGLEDQPSRPGRVWNRIPDAVRRQIVDLALEEPELSPRKLAVRFTETQRYFVSEASVYRLLVAHDLVTSPAFAIIKAADEFHEKTTRPNQLWQTDFTDLKDEPLARHWSGRQWRMAGDGSTLPPSSTPTVGTSSPGASAPPCAPGT